MIKDTGAFANEERNCFNLNHLINHLQQKIDTTRRFSNKNEVWLPICVEIEPTTFLVFNKPFLALSIDMTKNADVTACIN